MKTLLFTNLIEAQLLQQMCEQHDSFAFLNLDETPTGIRVSTYLSSIPGAIELDRITLYRNQSDRFRNLYIKFMGELNKANHSILWWGMSFR